MTLLVSTPFKYGVQSIIFLFLILSASTANAQNRVYVDLAATGLQNGSSWTDAYQNLQTAINASSNGDSIWVMKGTYYPTSFIGSSTDNRSKSFILKDNLLLYGGFNGTETNLSQRTSLNFTILSGDLGTPLDSSDNSYHVVVGANCNSTLNWFNISNGNASGTGSDTLNGINIDRNKGGALYLDSSSINLELCFIAFNSASLGGGAVFTSRGSTNIKSSNINFNKVHGSDENSGGGGAMFNVNSTINLNHVYFNENKCSSTQGGGAIRNEMCSGQLDSVYFTKNIATDGDGGGAVYNLNSNPVFTNVNFNLNSTNKEAGAMYNDGSSVVISDANFISNSSSNGGAMENDGGSDVILNRVLFSGNSSTGDGGAIHNWKSDIELNDVTFFQNYADGDGGAIKDYNQCTPKITNCTFLLNEATGNGGAHYIERDSHPIITNTLMARNKSGLKGGGICVNSGATPCSPVLTNVTIANNVAAQSGGGAFDDGLGSSKLRNSIVHGNIAPSLAEIDAPASILSSAVFNDIIGNEYYINGLSSPTLFTDTVFIDSTNNDYRLSSNGPAVDVGDSSFFASSANPNLSSIVTDIRGANRIMGSNIDLGAYEDCDYSVTPTVAFTNSPFPALVNTAVTLTASATHQGTSPLYVWSVNGSIKALTNVPSYTAVAGIDFVHGSVITVELHSSAPCKSGNPIDTIIASTTSIGIENPDKTDNFLVIIPNPNSGNFRLEVELISGEQYSITIYNLQGNTLFEKDIYPSVDSFKMNLDLEHRLAPGMYLMALTNNKGFSQFKRMMVQ